VAISKKPITSSESNRLAIIDMGSNTFNLLVADIVDQSLRVVHSEKIAVLLGRGMNSSRRIDSEAAQKALNAVEILQNKARSLHSSHCFALATAAMREAENGAQLAQEWTAKTGCPIRIISGEQEAELIARGVQAQVPWNSFRSALIMDIGGGSTECIAIADGTIEQLWSFKAGAVRMLEAWQGSDPARESELQDLLQLHRARFAPLLNYKFSQTPELLLGSSGFFDTLADLAFQSHSSGQNRSQEPYPMDLAQFMDWNSRIQKSSLQERLSWPGMPEFRAPYAVVSAQQTAFLMQQFQIPRLWCVRYSLKEGALLAACEKGWV
jgi:exopolyphosphatase / guanosine-5'-triphosphate,3'-diphosphate pyrophosphatase